MAPAAKIGQMMDVTFPRPRKRQEVLEHPEYYHLREELIGFLEAQGHPKPKDGKGLEAPEPMLELVPA